MKHIFDVICLVLAFSSLEGMGNSAQGKAGVKEAGADGKEGMDDAASAAEACRLAAERFAAEWEKVQKPDPLTEKQIVLLQENWKELEDSMENVGIAWFVSLFVKHPELQEVFIPLKGIDQEELSNHKAMKTLAVKVMVFVQKAVSRLYEQEKLDLLLRELGKRHYSYGAKQKYIDLAGPHFIEAIKPALQDTWSDEQEEAWVALFKYMSTMMKAALDIEERRAAEATIPYSVPAQNS